MKKNPVKEKIKEVLRSLMTFRKLDLAPGTGAVYNMTMYEVMGAKKQELHLTEETLVDQTLDKVVTKMLSGDVVSVELAGKEVYVELEEVIDPSKSDAGYYTWDKTGNNILCELKLYVKDLKTRDTDQELLLEKKYVNYMTVRERYDK